MSDQLVDESQLITGWCKTGDCPPGTVWRCCPDTDVDIPPGTPVLYDCQKKTLGNSWYFRDMQDYRGYVYAGGPTANTLCKIDKTTHSVVKTHNITDDDIPDGLERTSQSNIGRWVIWEDKIITSFIIAEDDSDNNSFGKIAVLDLDLNLLEWWDWPHTYRLPNAIDWNCTTRWSVFDNRVWTLVGRVTDMGGTMHNLLIGYDYYGNVTYLRPTPNIIERWFHRIEKIGNKYVSVSHLQDIHIGDDIDTLENAPRLNLSDPLGNGFESVGSLMIKYTTLSGKERMIIAGKPGNVGNNSDQIGFWVIDDQGNELTYIRQPSDPISECIGNNYLGEEYFGVAGSAIYVFGDNIVVGAMGNTCRTGEVYIYDSETFELKMQVGNTGLLPAQRGDRLGQSVFMDKNEIWMIADTISSGGSYIKWCKNRW